MKSAPIRAAIAGVTLGLLVLAYFAWGSSGHFPSVPTHAVPSPNGYDYYCRASDGVTSALNGISSDYPKLSSSPVPDFSGLSEHDKEVVLRTVSPDLKTLREGFSLPYVNPPVRVLDVHSDECVQFQTLGQLLLIDGDVKAYRGDWAGAANSYLDDIQIGVTIPHGSLTTGLMIGLVCEATGEKGLMKVEPHLSSSQAHAALVRLESIEALRSPIAANFLEDKYQVQASLLDHYKSSNWAFAIADSHFNEGLGPDTEKMALQLQILGKQKLFDETTHFRDAVVKSVDGPYAGRTPMEHVEVDPMTEAEDADSHTDPYVVSSHIFVRYVDCKTHNRMLITALALDEYFEQHRSYPESLTSLVPQYLAQIPDDPFAFSGSLHYRRTGSTYLLYSVGPDSKGDVVYGVNP